MKEQTMSNDHYTMLYAMFQASALNDTLDELEVSNVFIREFKREMTRTKLFLEKKVHKMLNDSFDVDNESFEGMDRLISERSKQFAKMTFEELGIIEVND